MPSLYVVVFLSKSLPQWATAVRDYNQVLCDVQSYFHWPHYLQGFLNRVRCIWIESEE